MGWIISWYISAAGLTKTSDLVSLFITTATPKRRKGGGEGGHMTTTLWLISWRKINGVRRRMPLCSVTFGGGATVNRPAHSWYWCCIPRCLTDSYITIFLFAGFNAEHFYCRMQQLITSIQVWNNYAIIQCLPPNIHKTNLRNIINYLIFL